MGCMACVGENKPGRHQVRCIRTEALISKSSVGQPITSLPPIGKRIGFKAWPTDERLGTFVLSRGEDPPLRSQLLEIKALDAPEQKSPPGTQEKVGTEPHSASLLILVCLRIW